MFNNLKKKYKNWKDERKLLKEMDEEEKKLNAEIPEDKYGIDEIIAVLAMKSEEDVEYESYLTDEEKENIRKQKELNKKILKRAVIVISISVIVFTITLNLYVNYKKSDLYKVTEPLLEEYYENKYGSKLKTSSIEELTYKDEENNDVSTGIYLLTTKDGNHIMSLNNELIGDDISISTTNETIKQGIDELVSTDNFILSSIETSYKDYYVDFNRFLEYINVLPSDMSVDELISSNKLTVTYFLFYQGNINLTNVENYINNFSSDSTFILIHIDVGLPNNVKIVTKEKVVNLDITDTLEKSENIYYHELDRTINTISDISITKYASDSIQGLESDYTIENAVMIEVDTEYSRNENTSKYYLVRFTNSNISKSNLVEISTSSSSDYYKELEIDEYEDIMICEYGTQTYLIAKDDIFIGNKVQKTSFLCKLGIC